MPSSLAPIAVFAYSRCAHLRQTIEALQKNREASQSKLYIYCDGSKGNQDDEAVAAVRHYARSIEGFLDIELHFRNTNMGLARSIVTGVAEVLELHETVIVVEDDLVVSPHFLSYMNQGLEIYRDEPRVASIHGYNYPVKDTLPETFFMRGADCWGWATWARSWKNFEPDGQKLLDQLEREGLIHSFDFDGAYSYSGMLRNQIKGRNDSWAVRWHASNFLLQTLTLYPGKSLVNNIGNDGSGTHSSATRAFDHALSNVQIEMQRIPLEESEVARQAFIAYFKAEHSYARRIGRRLSGLVKGVLRT
jgi:hypothetical protein